MPKPNEFPVIPVLDGTEENYTQTGGINGKWTNNQIFSDLTGMFQVANVAARDAIVTKRKGDICVITDSDGFGNIGLSFYTGSVWTSPFKGGGSPREEFLYSGKLYVKGTGNISSVTYGIVGNIVTLTIPINVYLSYIVIHESLSSIGGDFSLILKIVDQNNVVNQGTITTFKPPNVSFLKRDNLDTDPPTSTFNYQYTDDNPPTPLKKIVGYGSDEVHVQLDSIDSFSKFSLIINW